MKIIVIGEICKDVFYYGDVKRLSPEAPVPIFNPKYTLTNSGMAGNVVANILAMKDKSVEVEGLHQECLLTKTRYVDDKTNHMFIRIDEGEGYIDSFKFNEENMNKIKNADAVIISDYNKGFLTNEALIQIASMAKFSVMDTKRPLTVDIVSYFNFVKVNEDEYNKNKEILNKHLNKLLITLGKKGVNFRGKVIPSPAPKDTIDVSGAGDTFTSAFTLKYLETQKIDESIYHANYMSSIVVGKRGVVTPYHKNKKPLD